MATKPIIIDSTILAILANIEVNVTPPADQTEGQGKKHPTAFKKKYTLIDNFDKLDLAYSPIQVHLPTPQHQPHYGVQVEPYQLGIGLKPKKGEVEYGEVSKPASLAKSVPEYQELTAPELIPFLVDGTETFFANFQRPLAFRWNLRPDLGRFLTSRRFYLSPSGELKYPRWDGTLYSFDRKAIGNAHGPRSHSDYKATGPSAPADMPAGFVIDIAANIADKLNVNFNAMKSMLSFSQYISAAGAYGPNGETLTTGEGRPVNESHVLETLAILHAHYPKVFGPYINADTLGPGPARRLLLNRMYGQWGGLFGKKLKPPEQFKDKSEYASSLHIYDVFNDHGSIMYPGGGDLHPGAFGSRTRDDMTEVFNLISRLVSFTYWDENGTQYNPTHYYFVADFPVGEVTRLGASKEDKYTVNSDILDFTPFYNYYSRSITTNMSTTAVTSERQLPNIYTFYAFKSALNQASDDSYYDNLVPTSAETLAAKKAFKIGDYYTSPLSSGDASTLERYKKIVFGKDLSILQDVKSLKSSFAYGVQIDLPTTNKSNLAEALKEADLIDLFTTLIANYSIDVGSEVSSIHRFIMHHNTTAALSDLQILDLNAFYEQLEHPINDYVPYFNDEACISFGKLYSKYLGGSTLINLLQVTEFNQMKSALNIYFHKKKLDLINIYKGEKCHTEILVFEIAKFKVNSAGEKELVQSIFIPNLTDEAPLYSYIDTQVFPAQDYIYEVFAHTLVIGTKYIIPGETGGGDSNTAWENKIWPPGTNNYGFVRLYASQHMGADEALPENFATPITQPYAIIVRAPYYNTTSLVGGGHGRAVSVLSKPPLPPDISFYPYKDIDNKVLVLLNQNFGRKILPPILVLGADQENIDAQLAAQQYEAKPSGQLIYQNDDGLGYWEIYRTTEIPLSYRDFEGIAPTIINTGHSSGYNDVISQNTDYYYMARFVDVHGNISNPTNIFYLRVIREEGFPPYLDIKDHNISDFGRDVVNVPFKKFLKIKLKDFVRSVQGNGLLAGSEIGYTAPKTGGLQKYKFRITSKKTAKVIDINVTFDKKTVISPQTVPNALDQDPQTEAQKVVVTNAENKNIGPVDDITDYKGAVTVWGKHIDEGEPNC